jgi:uncharacterized membrane protein YfcA
VSLSAAHWILIFAVVYFGESIGLVAGGGGFIIQPFLIALKVPVHLAVATDITAACCSSFTAFLVYRRRQLVRWDLLKPMIPPLVLGGIAGVFLLHSIPAGFIEKFLALSALLFVGAGVLSRAEWGAVERDVPAHAKWSVPLFGLLFGMYSTFSGAGTGIFGSYFLTAIFGLTFLQALAVLSMAFVLASAIGACGYFSLGMIDFELLGVMLGAHLFAGITGARLAIKLGNRWLKPIRTAAVLGFAGYLLAR